MSKTLSTSALAKTQSISGKELFSQLESCGYIHREGDEWKLLPEGESAGGQYVEQSSQRALDLALRSRAQID